MKGTISILLLLLSTLCTYAQNEPIYNVQNNPIYQLNTFHAELGGYIIELSDGGKHGLVVAMKDQLMSSAWECFCFGDITKNNNWWSDNLLNQAANHDTDGAKFKDWRLPTKRELNLIYWVARTGDGARIRVRGSAYWSSTEASKDEAWYQMFNNGAQHPGDKKGKLHVRAVRAF